MCATERQTCDGWRVVRALRAGSSYRAGLDLVCKDGALAVAKHYDHAGPVFRLVAAPWMARQEARAYRLLAGVPGVPRCLGRWGRRGLLIEHVGGVACSALAPGGLPPAFFDRLRALVEEMHARGVVHCDLKAADNILVAPDGRPLLLDFVAAQTRPPRWHPLLRFIYRHLEADDLLAVVKLKSRLAPELMSPQEKRALRNRSAGERMVRAARDGLRRLFRLLADRHA